MIPSLLPDFWSWSTVLYVVGGVVSTLGSVAFGRALKKPDSVLDKNWAAVVMFSGMLLMVVAGILDFEALSRSFK